VCYIYLVLRDYVYNTDLGTRWMHIISRKKIREFIEKEPQSETSLDEWYTRMKGTKAANLAELRKTFPSADIVGSCLVFNAGGNKYRIVTKISFKSGTVFMRFVLTHGECDKDKWKSDCR
jgi:mRNA interferase HigB